MSSCLMFGKCNRGWSDAYNQDRIENGEMRWQSVGEIEGIAVILVSHTWHDKDGEEYIRIISARPADKKEKKHYEQNRYSDY